MAESAAEDDAAEPAASHGTGSEEGCPESLSAAQCGQLGGALDSGGSSEVADDECPPALSHEQCVAAGQAVRGSEGVAASEGSAGCPSSYSEAQCQALGDAYHGG